MSVEAAREFVDANILVYAFDASAGNKKVAAEHLLAGLWAAGTGCLSVQVLQEFYTQATRASRSGRLTHAEAATLITAWQRFPVQDLNVLIVERAMSTCQRFQISYWDAAILEGARTAGCATVLSEDMQHGQSFDGVRVIDPFRIA